MNRPNRGCKRGILAIDGDSEDSCVDDTDDDPDYDPDRDRRKRRNFNSFYRGDISSESDGSSENEPTSVSKASSPSGVAGPSSASKRTGVTKKITIGYSSSKVSNKPIMEKRRRARINNCLNELKSLILDAMKKDPARHSKLEKADILEMTVKHLETMQRQQVAMSAATDPQVLNKFRAGFSECAGEVGRFPGLEPPVRRRLLQHLANCLNSTTAAAEPTVAPAVQETPPVQQTTQVTGVQVHIVPAVDAQVTASNGIFFSTTGNTAGLQLVPTRLPNGDIALVLPSSNAQILRQVTTPPSTSPSPSSTSSSSTSSSPLPLLLPIPTRTASASSASSSSPVAFERLTVSTSTNTPTPESCSQTSFPSPVSPSSSTTNSYDMSEDHSSPRPFSPAPLALVVKKTYQDSSDDERPWRPW